MDATVKVFDCFTFFNEVELLQVRLQELFHVVDQFIIIETSRTFSGDTKPAVFLAHEERFAWARSKITYLFIDSVPSHAMSHRHNRNAYEVMQRNFIMLGLDRAGASDMDLVMVSDLDEIPRPSAVASLKNNFRGSVLYLFNMKMIKYFANNVSDKGGNGQSWLGTVACRYSTLRAVLPQGARIGDPMSQRSGCLYANLGRNLTPYEVIVDDAGWHMSYMGGFAAVTMKALNMVDSHRPNLGNSNQGSGFVSPALHNHSAFRRSNADSLTHALDHLNIKLAEVFTTETDIKLGLPSVMESSPLQYEQLFFFSDAL